MIPNVLSLSFLIKIRLEFSRNLTYQKRYLHFSIGSKSKQIFKPLSLFYNLTFHSTPLSRVLNVSLSVHKTKIKLKFSRELLIRTSIKVVCNFLDTLRLVQELSGVKQTILMWQHKGSKSVERSYIYSNFSCVCPASCRAIDIDPFVVYVFLSSRNLYWC